MLRMSVSFTYIAEKYLDVCGCTNISILQNPESLLNAVHSLARSDLMFVNSVNMTMVQRTGALTRISCCFPALFGLVLHLVKQKRVLNQNFKCITISLVQEALVSYPVLLY